MTLSQVSVLSRLDRDGPTTVTNLAHAEGVRPQSMGATVSALETTGLVSGAPDPNDGRQDHLVADAGLPRMDPGRPRRQGGLAVSRDPEKAFGIRAGAAHERGRAAQAPDRVLKRDQHADHA